MKRPCVATAIVAAMLGCVQGFCADYSPFNLGFDWGSTCPWESKVNDDGEMLPVIVRNSPSRCSILRIDNDGGSQGAAIRSAET